MSEDYSVHAVRVAVSPLGRFSEFLQANGKRLTEQRRIIVEQVFSHHDHFDADELMDHLKGPISRRQVSRPTVYRTLNELVEAGMLRRMTLGGRGVYEHDYGYPRHDHLHCTVCNNLLEFQSKQLDRIRDEVARQYDFQVISHRMFISGICADCRRRQSRKSRARR
jgi:Fur family ferric uptake transcriptional regulator